jgi:hypothetical protein
MTGGVGSRGSRGRRSDPSSLRASYWPAPPGRRLAAAVSARSAQMVGYREHNERARLMDTEVTLRTVCVPSDDVVAREIEGEIIIVPLVAGIGSADDELYTLNETGHAIWLRLDGSATLADVAATLAEEFDGPRDEIEADVLGFAAEMVERGILATRV